MSYKVTAESNFRLSLNEADKTVSILQNISIILATKSGTVPMYREFGLQRSFQDKPLSVVKSLIYAEVKETIERFEPRAEVIGVNVEFDAEAPGRIIPIVEVNIIE